MKILGYIYGVILNVFENRISVEDALERIRIVLSEKSKVTEEK